MAMPENQEIQAAEITPKAPRETKTVVFDKSLGAEKSFQVEFSERGFVVGDARLSFEYLEDTLNKGITLTMPDGRVLSPIEMQKIMKYKFLFPKPSQSKKAEESAKSAPQPESAQSVPATPPAPAPIAEVIDENTKTIKKLLAEKAKILKTLSGL